MTRFAFPEDHPHVGKTIDIPPYRFVDGVCEVENQHAPAIGRILTRFHGCVELAPGEEPARAPAPSAPAASTPPSVPSPAPAAPPVADVAPVADASAAVATAQQVGALVADVVKHGAEEAVVHLVDRAEQPGAGEAQVLAAGHAIAGLTADAAETAIAAADDVRVLRTALVAEQAGRKRKSVLAAIARRGEQLTPRVKIDVDA